VRTRLAADGERGETLLELIIAIAILGVCVVAIGAGITLSVKISSIHKDQATAQAFLHNYAETLQSSYSPCSGGIAPNYVTIASLVRPDASWSNPTATVKFWDPTAAAFNSATCPGTDPNLQQVTVKLVTTDGLVSESLVVVVRSTS
jgi:type II secretory pathway pseudopilin PulG